MTNGNWQPIVRVTGRILIASLFILGGVSKIGNYAATLGLMDAAGLNPAALLLPLTIVLEVGGGLLVAIGGRWAVPAALALAAFTIATNLYFHDFWHVAPALKAIQLSLFFKNIAIIGALLFIAATGWEPQEA